MSDVVDYLNRLRAFVCEMDELDIPVRVSVYLEHRPDAPGTLLWVGRNQAADEAIDWNAGTHKILHHKTTAEAPAAATPGPEDAVSAVPAPGGDEASAACRHKGGTHDCYPECRMLYGTHYRERDGS